jgi:hypothetical protein
MQGVRGSNPLSSTEKAQVRDLIWGTYTNCPQIWRAVGGQNIWLTLCLLAPPLGGIWQRISS